MSLFDLTRDHMHTDSVPEGWLTVELAAEKLGVGPQRVRDLIKAGRLPAEKIGKGQQGFWLIKEEDLELVKNRKPGRPRNKRKGRPPKVG